MASQESIPSRIGPYLLGERLGAGGMGVVYRGHHRRLERSVALKRIRPERADSEVARSRFLYEAQATARLSHPAIVQIYDILSVDGQDWIVMEFVDGKPLARVLDGGPLSPESMRQLAMDIVSGLAVAHAEGIVHRDLKSENVLVTPAGRAKILDFGLAKQVQTDALEQNPSFSLPGGLRGTPRAMSPEQVLGRPINPLSDYFALGVLCYEMLTGVSPFGNADLLETLNKICTSSPPSVRDVEPTVPEELSRLVDRLLEKDPAFRPQTPEEILRALTRDGAGESVALEELGPSTMMDEASLVRADLVQRLDGGSVDALAASRLRTWPLPELPERPYPLLLPYQHPDLFFGRERDLTHLKRLLSLPILILGVHAPSGAGKSSLLGGGLVPGLRSEGYAVAFDRHPADPLLASRLLADLLDDDPAPGPEPRQFAEQLVTVGQLATRPPVLVLDQIEDLLERPGAEAPWKAVARANVGALLAATAERRPGLEAPICSWILAYRQEFHGEVVAWLGDVLRDARAVDLPGIAGLAHDLSGSERYQAWPLLPLGTPPPGSEARSEARQTFRRVVEAPLELRGSDGGQIYSWTFADDGAIRLAEAFMEARLARPDAPLTPELQVVLAYLLTVADTAGEVDGEGRTVVRVPEHPEELIDEALEDHLRRALDAVFPLRREGSRSDRTRALLALRELAAQVDGPAEGLAPEALARAIGSGGEEILEALASPRSRWIISRRTSEGWRYVLAHDRLAEVVRRMVERQDRLERWGLDGELLAARRFVALQSALYRTRGGQAPRLDKKRYAMIEKHAEALLFDEERRCWWAACQARQTRDHQHRTAWTALAVLALLVVAFGAWNVASIRAEREATLLEVARGEPDAALRAILKLSDAAVAEDLELSARLAQRQFPFDVLERGAPGVDEAERGRAMLRAVEVALPLLDADSPDLTAVGIATWVLDFFPGREAELAERARALRQHILRPLREASPPPDLDPAEWASIPAGTFRMGAAPEPQQPDWDLTDEQPQHTVNVSPFRILIREVTNSDYRRLIADHPGAPEMPAADITWYAAYAYAAWLGGRLPTEAEWEYAAWAGCPHAFCDREGRATERETVCWYRRTAVDLETFEIGPKEPMLLEANPWGLFDMCGNLWEWTANWHGPYSAEPQSDPAGPPGGAMRVLRGGSFWDDPFRSRLTNRLFRSPRIRYINLGFRVVLPEPDGAAR